MAKTSLLLSTAIFKLKMAINKYSTDSTLLLLPATGVGYLMRSFREFISSLESFEKEMHADGPFFFGKELGWVDILIAPCKYKLDSSGCHGLHLCFFYSNISRGNTL